MMELVPIEHGQFALIYFDHFMPRGGLRVALESLIHRGSGWDAVQRPADQFDIVQVDHVMKKTFRDCHGRRHDRAMVAATATTESELIALRDKIFTIGFETDNAIEAEMYRLVEPYRAEMKERALMRVHQAMPHVFGRSK